HTGLEEMPDGFERMAAFYAERAAGGIGMIITGGISPNEEGGVAVYDENGNPVFAASKLNTDREAEGHRMVTDAVHSADPDVKIVMTRDSDDFPSLRRRVAIANESQADLFISIHCDAFDNPKARGSSTFVMGMHKSEESLRVAMKENASIYQEDDYETRYAGFNPDDPDTYIALALKQSVYLNQSLELGSLIQNQFSDRVGRKDRGVKQAGYYVISFTNMPSVLVELGFLTNPEEEDFLNSQNGKELMASALLRAFRTYKEKHHPGPAAPEPAPAPQPAPEEPAAPAAAASNPDAPLASPTYRIQILASQDPLSTDDSRLAHVGPVVEYIRNGLYKYAVGSFDSSVEASLQKSKIQQKGFPDAFVVKFEGTTWEEQGVKPLRKN
ncbi:MAG: N-acetylmuramoyl-L-alanine amidase, partial [Flavobacteriales bacterium]